MVISDSFKVLYFEFNSGNMDGILLGFFDLKKSFFFTFHGLSHSKFQFKKV